MKKFIIAIAAVLATATSASAFEYLYSVEVNKTDGTKVAYKFSQNPVVTVEGDDMKMTYDGGTQSVLYPFAEVVNLTFSKTENSGVDNVGVDGTVSFAVTRDALEATGLAEGTAVTIYDTAGAMRAQGNADADGSLTLPLGSLGQGVYVVKAGNNSFKFIR